MIDDTNAYQVDKNETYSLYSRIMLWLVETGLLVSFAKIYTQPPPAMANSLTEFLPTLK